MARVAMVVTNGCSPDPRVLRHATWLMSTGHEVSVHAFDRQELHPKSEDYNGVRILRYHLGHFPYGGNLQTLRGIREFNRQVIRSLTHTPPDVVYCHDADTLAIGIKIKSSHSVPVVFDMHDLQHTWVRMKAPRSPIRKLAGWLMEKTMIRRLSKTDLIVVSSGKISADSSYPGFREYISQYGYESVVIENRSESSLNRDLNKTQNWKVGYVGRVREERSFKLLIQSILLIDEDMRPEISIAGDGTASKEVREMLKEAEKSGITSEFLGPFDTQQLDRILRGIDVMFAMYPPERGNILQGAIPVKMFDAASAGIPSVVNAGCLMGEIAEREGLGIPVEWNNPDMLKDALLSCRKMKVQSPENPGTTRLRFVDAFNALLTRTVDEPRLP